MTTFPQRRPVSWLVLLLGLNLVLLSAQARNEEGQILIRSWAMVVVTPVVAVLTGGAGWISDSVRTFFRLYRAERENRQLRQENSSLRLQNQRLKGLSTLWLRSRELSRLRSQFDFEMITANVIGRSAPFFAQRLLINVGSREEIGVDSAVLHSGGIVGRVVTANLLSAEVEVITNSGAAVGGVVADGRIQGVARGDGSDLLIFDFVSNSDEVPIGAEVRTSGWDRIYPAGLPIGRVVRSQPGAMIYREIRVRPYVDPSQVEEVLVVVEAPPAETGIPSDAESEKPERTGG